MKNKEVLDAINKFQHMLETYPDSKNSVQDFRNFMRYFLRLKPADQPLPTLEIMSILKQNKPTVFQTLKQQGKTDNVLGLLTETSITPETAESRLKEYADSIS
ncbi:hypothetical protein [Salibacterium sp. K-3]